MIDMDMPKDREVVLRIDPKGEVYVYGSYPTELHKAVSVDEEVRHGKWEEYLKEGLRWKCSLCGSRFTTPFYYCPHCGAKMESDCCE